MKKSVLVISLFILSGILAAQQVQNSTEFFRTQLNHLQSDILVHDNLIQDEEFRSPWLDEVELRTETEDFQFKKQEYLLRLSTSSLRLRQAQEFLFESYKKEAALKLEKLVRVYMLKAYESWIATYINNQKLIAYESSLALYLDLKKTTENNAASGRYNPSELLSIVRSVNNLEVEIFQLRNNDFIHQFGDTSILILPEYEGMISLAEIEMLLYKRDWKQSQINEFKIGNELRQYELSAELAEKKKIFDFMQFRYDGPHTDAFREKFNVGLAFRLPIAGQNKIDIKERQLDLKVEQNETAVDLYLHHLEYSSKKSKLLNRLMSLNKIRNLKEQEEEIIDQTIDDYLNSGDFSAKELLDLYRLKLENRLDLLEYEEKAWSSYLDYLQTSGILSEKPYRDFLHQDLPELGF